MRVTQKHLVYSLLGVIAIVSVFILYIGYISWSPINANAVARIKPLMTEKQVEQILGGKCTQELVMPERRVKDKIVPASTIRIWRDERAQCWVHFDAAGLVERAGFMEATSPGILNLLRSAFGRWR